MATTAAELIKRAYYQAQVLDPNEEIEGFQQSEGVHELNKIIDTWGSLSIYIPSYKILTQALVAGTYSYTITPVITELSDAHLVDSNNVQTGLRIIDLQFFNTLNFANASTNRSRPSLVFPQNDFANWPTSTKLIFYSVPDSSYTATLYVMQRLTNVTYQDEFTNVPNYWTAALEVELAYQLINIYSTVPSVVFMKNYEDAMKAVKAANKRDRTVKVMNVFQEIRRMRPWSSYAD